MKQNILIIILCLSLVLITNGCDIRLKNKPDNFKDTYNVVKKYFESAKKDANVAAIAYDETKQIITVTLIDNSTKNQEKFLDAVNVDKKFIKFEQGGPNYTFDTKLSILEEKTEGNIGFNKYLTKENRTVYLAKNIAELYVFDQNSQMTFAYYATNTNQSLENSINSLTDLLDKQSILKDGGTTIYKKEEKNMTIIVCNTLEGNKDIYIGDYNLNHNNVKCS